MPEAVRSFTPRRPGSRSNAHPWTRCHTISPGATDMYRVSLTKRLVLQRHSGHSSRSECLTLPHCPDCDAILSPASAVCTRCRGARLDVTRCCGDGTVVSWRTVHGDPYYRSRHRRIGRRAVAVHLAHGIPARGCGWTAASVVSTARTRQALPGVLPMRRRRRSTAIRHQFPVC